MRALAHLGAGVEQVDTLDGVVAVVVQFGLAAFGEAEREADVLVGTGEALAAAQPRGIGRQGGNRAERDGGVERFGEAAALGAGVDHLGDGDAGGQAALGDALGMVVQHVAAAHLDRVHPQRLGELVHLTLGDERALRATEATERAADGGIGVDAVRVDAGVGHLVGAGNAEVHVPEHLVGGVVVATGVEPAVGFDCRDTTVAGGAQAGVHAAAVALVVPDDRLLARPLRGDGALGGGTQALRGEAEQDLQGHVFASAERSADGRVDDTHLVLGQVERMGDLVAIFVGPLSGDLDRHPAVVVEVGDARFGLQIGVLLVGQFVGALHHHIGLAPAFVDIALADAVADVDVRVHAILGVQHHIGGEGLVDVAQHGQRLPLHVQQFGRGLGLLAGVGDDERDLVGLPARHVGGDVTAAGVVQAHQHGLVLHRQAVLVHGHIGRGEDGVHAGGLAGGIDIERGHTRVGLVAEHGEGDERVGRDAVARIAGRAVDLGQRVAAGGAFAHAAGGNVQCGHRAPPAAAACSTASKMPR